MMLPCMRFLPPVGMTMSWTYRGSGAGRMKNSLQERIKVRPASLPIDLLRLVIPNPITKVVGRRGEESHHHQVLYRNRIMPLNLHYTV